MKESIIQTTINKFLSWLAKKSVTALYKRTHFWVFSWGLDENTDLYLMSEKSYHGYHRFGVREEKYADTPQTNRTTDATTEPKTEQPQTDCPEYHNEIECGSCNHPQTNCPWK